MQQYKQYKYFWIKVPDYGNQWIIGRIWPEGSTFMVHGSTRSFDKSQVTVGPEIPQYQEPIDGK
jgi:hypothetical protein